MEFIAYTYHFTPQLEERQLDLFSDTYELRQSIMKRKNEVFSEILSNIRFYYRNKIYAHNIVSTEDSITIMQLANSRTITFERNFSKIRESAEPSCFIIIDNRSSSQTILVERNARAFPDIESVIRILERNFNNALLPKKLWMEIKKRPSEREFWDFCNKNKGKINLVRFSYKYPNVGRAAEKMRELLKDSSKEVKSDKTVVQFESQDALEIRQDNEILKGLADDSYQGGNAIDLRLKGSQKLHQTGHTTLTVSIEPQWLIERLFDKIKEKINASIK